ncbi:MAG: amidase [Dehalococcoidia bacterium]|nr:amidase [Dehalococcoidia bacterium]
MTSGASSPLAAVPLASHAAGLREGAIDLHSQIDDALRRIDRYDAQVRAFLPEPGRADRVHAQADALAARYPEAASRPPLYGVLVGVKDIFAVDRLPTRAGSAIPAEEWAMPQGPAVTRLIEAGALILGKTVTTEFAYFDPGATINPHNPLHTPGGSSSGSAAAVACGYVPLAIGSQTVGSVLRPAAFVGVGGYKGSYGRVSTAGAVAYAPSVDHVGWFTHDVAGARLVAAALYADWRREVSREDGASMAPRPPVLGIPAGPYLAQAQPAAVAAFEVTVAALAARGVEVRRVPLLEDIAAINMRHRALATFEFGEVHAERFLRWGSMFRAASAALFDESRHVTPEAHAAGLVGRLELRARLHAAMDRHGIDLWASLPATGPAPRGLTSTGDPVMNVPWTHAGVPAASLPAGSVDGLPVGLQLAGRFGADEEFLAAAEAIEGLLPR